MNSELVTYLVSFAVAVTTAVCCVIVQYRLLNDIFPCCCVFPLRCSYIPPTLLALCPPYVAWAFLALFLERQRPEAPWWLTLSSGAHIFPLLPRPVLVSAVVVPHINQRTVTLCWPKTITYLWLHLSACVGRVRSSTTPRFRNGATPCRFVISCSNRHCSGR